MGTGYNRFQGCGMGAGGLPRVAPAERPWAGGWKPVGLGDLLGDGPDGGRFHYGYCYVFSSGGNLFKLRPGQQFGRDFEKVAALFERGVAGPVVSSGVSRYSHPSDYRPAAKSRGSMLPSTNSPCTVLFGHAVDFGC